MIGHQDVGMHYTAVSHRCRMHAFEIKTLITCGSATRLMIVAALNNVLRNVG